MLTEFISNFNWIDIFILVVLGRVVFLGMKSNLLTEIFSLFGTCAAVFITLHYYVRFAHFLHQMVFVPEMLADIFGFIILWLTVHVIFKIIISGWGLIVKTEAHPAVNQWGGLILGLARGALVGSLLLAMFIITGSHYIRQMVNRTLTGKVLIDLAPNAYSTIFDGVIAKYFPNEEINEQAISFRDILEHDKDKKKNEQ